jgi:DNA-binding NtrC family response regulator
MQISERRSRPRDEPDFAQRPAHQVKEVLFVDPDADRLQDLMGLMSTLDLVADVEGCQDFDTARKRIFLKPPDLLVTNLQLGEYNGLHLVYLAAGTATRCVVYSTHNDKLLQRHAKEAGAFYEQTARLPQVLASYVHAVLPERDQRDPNVLDRRRTHRGGRRCDDV